MAPGGAAGAGVLSRLAPSSVVIFNSSGDAWRMGTLLPFDAGSATAQVQDAENRQLYTVRVPDDLHVMESPLPFPDEIDDLVLLKDVADGPLLCSLRMRYQDERYVTSLGREAILAFNPGKQVDADDASSLFPARQPSPALYLRDLSNLPPHPWTLAARALRHTSATHADSAVILCGDQGGGKTTAAQAVFEFFLHQLPPHASPAALLSVCCETGLLNEAFAPRGPAEFYRAELSAVLGVSRDELTIVACAPSPPNQPRAPGKEVYDVSFTLAPSLGSKADRLQKRFQQDTISELAALFASHYSAKTAVVAATPANFPVKPLACSVSHRIWPSKAVPTVVNSLTMARTTRNANASKAIVVYRYGISTTNSLAGLEVRAYMLEATRATGPPLGERTFHVFYYLLAGASDWERDRYHLPSRVELSEVHFNILGRSRSTGPVDLNSKSPWEQSMATLQSSCGDWTTDVEDLAAGYQALVDSLDACGVSTRMQDWIFRVVAAILHLGQLTFVPQAETPGTSVVSEATKENLLFVADCLQISEQGLEAALTTHIQKVRDEPVDIRLTPVQCAAARDTLIRSLYSKVVEVTTATLNHLLEPEDELCGWVSAVDAVGTEDGAHNNLEALATNFANEVLQLFYNRTVHENDVAECREELGPAADVAVEPYADNYGVVKLLRAGGGLFSLVDEECANARPTDSNLLAKLTAKLSDHRCFEKRRDASSTFNIKHSHGDIQYNVSGMTTVNRNSVLLNDLRLCLAASLCKFTSQAFQTPKERRERLALQSEHDKSPGNEVPAEFVAINTRMQLTKQPSGRQTFLSKTLHQVASLMQLIESSKPFFVRCIRPAKGLASSSGHIFHGRHVMKQLKSLGVLSTLKQKQKSFAVRQTFQGLLHSCWMLRAELAGGGFDPRSRVENLCANLRFGPQDYCLGKTMVFLSKTAYGTLVEKQQQRERSCNDVVLAWARGWLALQKLGTVREAAVAQRKEDVRSRIVSKQESKRRTDKETRGAALMQKVQHEEARGRRDVDNLEAIDYIAIMTGLIEGVDRVRHTRSHRMRSEEREKQRYLRSLVTAERKLEEDQANDRLTQRMLAQGGRLDRVLNKKFGVEQKLMEKRVKVETAQQRALTNRLREEKNRLNIERKLLEKEGKHLTFLEQKKHDREHIEMKRLEQQALDEQARGARIRARQAWEESKREEFDLETLEAEVVQRVELELEDTKKKEMHYEKKQKEALARESRRKLEHLERLRVAKQLEREQQEKAAQAQFEDAKKRREREAWREQQNQRMLKEEMDKIHDGLEKRRFARRQRERSALSTPQVFNQLVEPLMSNVSTPSLSSRRSPARSARSATPGRRVAPPSPFVMSGGRPVHAPLLSTSQRRGLVSYAEALPKSPARNVSPYPRR